MSRLNAREHETSSILTNTANIDQPNFNKRSWIISLEEVRQTRSNNSGWTARRGGKRTPPSNRARMAGWGQSNPHHKL